MLTMVTFADIRRSLAICADGCNHGSGVFMRVQIASWVTGALFIYGAVGIVFAIPFVVRGVGRIDPIAVESSWGFRVAILLGSAAFWPLLLKRWFGGQSAPGERNAHRDVTNRYR